MVVMTETYSLSHRVGDKKAIEYLAGAGFDALDYTMYWAPEGSPVFGEQYKEYARELLETAQRCRIPFLQAHAPFGYPFEDGEEEWKKLYGRILRSMEFASLLGAKIIVVHPIVCLPQIDQKAYNLEFFRSLAPLCRQLHIRVALENMWGTDRRRGCIVSNVCSLGRELAEYVDALGEYTDEAGERYFTACLDVGHSAIVGEEPADAVRALGSRLGTVHIHDNDYREDSHMLPFTGELDWKSLMEALKNVDYRGPLNLEVLDFAARFPEELLEEACGFTCRVGRYLAGLGEGGNGRS